MPDRLTDAGIRGTFYEIVQNAPASWADILSFKTTSNHRQEIYAMLGMPPALREWVGGRQPHDIRENAITVVNKPFEATVKVLKEELRRGENAQILLRIAELADRGVAHPRKLLTDLILSGEATACYDGQFFFDTDHSEGDSGTQNNDITTNITTTTDPTVAEMRDAIMDSIQAILAFKDDKGEPMNENATQFMVQVPTPFMAAAMSALSLPVIDTGVSNILANLDGYRIQLSVNQRLTWTEKFATYRTDGRAKPFILQEEVPLDLPSLAEGSEEEFMNRNHLYSAEWWGGAAFGLWQHAVLNTFT